MRMWGVPPELMCREHLLGEHVEMHMFVGTINKGISIRGYVERGQVNPREIQRRHRVLAIEILKRGYKHTSPLPEIKGSLRYHFVNVSDNLKELHRRCSECRQRIDDANLPCG